MQTSELFDVLRQLEREREIPLESLIETLKQALASAYKRNSGATGEIEVEIAKSGIKVFRVHTVVEGEPETPSEITVDEARQRKEGALAGDTIREEVTPGDFGRIAAQTAKQVVVQRLREVERERVYDEFIQREGEVLTGVVQRKEQRSVIMSLGGRTEALLPPSEQVPGEVYRFNDRMKVYLMDVRRTPKGPQVIVSRTHPSLIRRLFELEVPEIADGTVVIKSVAREPGARTKIAVASRDESVDPVGSCVGHRGSRVQAVVNELGGEKIDIIRWRDDMATFVGEALKPAKIASLRVNEDEKSVLAIVPDGQLSLAIGKEGQNVRLAARLTGLRIDIRGESQLQEQADREAEALVDAALDEEEREAEALAAAGGEPAGEAAQVPEETPGEPEAAASSEPAPEVVEESDVPEDKAAPEPTEATPPGDAAPATEVLEEERAA
ncbi:MAG TPA: transcription termination factor NusA [Armatimonadota bacterium]|jgi:N utilization substance protein A